MYACTDFFFYSIKALLSECDPPRLQYRHVCDQLMSVISLIFVLTRLDLDHFYCTVCCNGDLIHVITGTAPKRGLLVVYSDGMMDIWIDTWFYLAFVILICLFFFACHNGQLVINSRGCINQFKKWPS